MVKFKDVGTFGGYVRAAVERARQVLREDAPKHHNNYTGVRKGADEHAATGWLGSLIKKGAKIGEPCTLSLLTGLGPLTGARGGPIGLMTDVWLAERNAKVWNISGGSALVFLRDTTLTSNILGGRCGREKENPSVCGGLVWQPKMLPVSPQ